MAMLWSKVVDGTRYEVRRAGATRRLYTNGVFHSQFNPRMPVTGGVWDLLTISAFFAPPGALRRILVLGAGAGTVLLQLRRFVDPEVLVGIDHDHQHLSVASNFFDVDDDVGLLVAADARHWLEDYDGPPFDMIVEDLFAHSEWEPQRAMELDASWARLLLRRLGRRGIVAVNFLSAAELGRAAFASSPALRRRIASAFRLWTPNEENFVGAFLRFPARASDLRRALRALPLLDTRRKTCRLRFSVARLW